ncbi:MAG: cupin domain-containing protein [Cyanobacteria bacterium SIG29]|nr:cupin domain-containing protein [Cyanobacteria bacterium SIG29]
MNINAINFKTYSPKINNVENKNQSQKSYATSINSRYTSANVQANYLPISFSGNAQNIKSAFLITREEEDIPLLETKNNGSYVVDFDSQTEVIYGKKAISYLNRESEFIYDTQVIIPKKCEGTLEIKGETIPLPENSAVMINGGTEAKVKIKKGYPMIVLSKKDYDWYERYGKNSQNESIQNKFLELMYYNSHLYNGEFSPNMLLPEKLTSESFLKNLGIDKYKSANNLIADLTAKRDSLSEEDKKEFDKSKALLTKLFETNLIETKDNGYIRFKSFYNVEYQTKIFKEKGFSEEEIQQLMPLYKQTKTLHSDSRFARASKVQDLPEDIIKKLKSTKIIHNNQKMTDYIFWIDSFGSEEALRTKLTKENFTPEEQNIIVKYWKDENKTGFDISGLKFINKNVAVYNLNDKVNNWTLEKTNWVTNSTALGASDGTTPFIGTSLVQTDENRVFSMNELRKGEKLHRHPNRDEKRQTEMYLITSGAAALEVVRNGKPEIKILKEGDLAVIDAGVEHCVNSVLGEYEHIVVQVPSAFQYGFDFKCITPEPEGYNKEEFTKTSKFALEESRELKLI